MRTGLGERERQMSAMKVTGLPQVTVRFWQNEGRRRPRRSGPVAQDTSRPRFGSKSAIGRRICRVHRHVNM